MISLCKTCFRQFDKSSPNHRTGDFCCRKCAAGYHTMGIGERFEFEKTGRIEDEPVVRKNGRLFFLIGIARSGKSTVANRWVNYHCNIRKNELVDRYCHFGEYIHPKSDNENPRVVVNADQIRLTLHGKRFWPQAEPMVEAIKLFMIRHFLDSGYDVLVDGTHTTKKSIRKLLEIDHNADFYLVDTPAQVCKDRARACGQEDLVVRGVIDRMDAHLKEWKANPEETINELRKEFSVI